MKTPANQVVEYGTTIHATGTTDLNQLFVHVENHNSESSGFASQKLALTTDTLNIHGTSGGGISLHSYPDGSTAPKHNTELAVSVLANTISVDGGSGQAIYANGNSKPATDTDGTRLFLQGKDISLRGGHSYGGTYTNNIAVYAIQGARVEFSGQGDGSSLEVTATNVLDPGTDPFYGNIALFARDGMILADYQNGADIVLNGGLASFASNEDSQVRISALEGSSTVINGKFMAVGSQDAIGGITIDTAGQTTITAPFIMSQSGTVSIDIGSESLNGSEYGIRSSLQALYGDADDGPSIINVHLAGDKNVFTGFSYRGADEAYNQISLTLDDGARWDMEDPGDGDHNMVTNLVLNGGIVNLRYNETEAAPLYKLLEVTNFSGNNGLLLFNAELTDDMEASNRIDIQNAELGTHLVHVTASSGNEPTSREMAGYLVRVVNDKGATFLADNNRLEYGVYFKDYSLKQRLNNAGETEWYLVLDPETDPGPDPDPTPAPELTPSAEAVVAMSGMGAQNAMNLSQLSDVRKRLGEIRNGAQDGLWVSFAAQKDRLDGFRDTRFDQEAYRVNLGFDRKVGDWLLGANFKAVTANQKTLDTKYRADGDAEAQGVNLYATWNSSTTGSYADFVLGIDRYHQDISTRMLSGEGVDGDYTNLGLGASVEVGRKIPLGEEALWFIEPQAQLSYYWVRGDDFRMSNGMTVEQDNFDSLTGRLGLSIGRDFKDANGNQAGQFYTRMGVNHEFLGQQSLKVNDSQFNSSLLGTRVYYGLGCDWNIMENLKAYGYVERETGAHYEKELEVSVGLKYSF